MNPPTRLVMISSLAHGDPSSGARISRLSKALIVGQSLIITALSIWLYREYQDNQYLQTYLSSLFEGQGSIVAFVGLGGILAVGFVGILLKAGNIMGEIEHLSSKVDNRPDEVPAFEAPSTMPVLEVVGSHPVDDISRIHGSMRRWNAWSSRPDPDHNLD